MAHEVFKPCIDACNACAEACDYCESACLKEREVAKLAQAIEREGMTLIPLKLYFNPKGRAKIELGIAKGKKLHDKRDTEKARDWSREKGRLLREKG